MKLKVAVTVLGILMTIFLLNWFYHTTHEQHWKEQKQAIQRAYDETAMVKANQVQAFNGGEPYMIVFGEDKKGQKLIVWVGKDEVHSEYAKEGLEEQTIKMLMLEKDPDIHILRITPGKMNENYIWEVFYKKIDDQGERHYYDFYNFKDGALIDTYRLSKLPN